MYARSAAVYVAVSSRIRDNLRHERFGYHRNVLAEPDVAAAAGLLADTTRARFVQALSEVKALPASELAAVAGVSNSTASAHLAKLVAGGLVAGGLVAGGLVGGGEVGDAEGPVAPVPPEAPVPPVPPVAKARPGGTEKGSRLPERSTGGCGPPVGDVGGETVGGTVTGGPVGRALVPPPPPPSTFINRYTPASPATTASTISIRLSRSDSCTSGSAR
jgi:hypothetical protein